MARSDWRRYAVTLFRPKKPDAEIIEPPNAVRILRQIVRPADDRRRVEIVEVWRAYIDICCRTKTPIALPEVFGKQAKAFAQAAGFPVIVAGGKVWWCGVQLYNPGELWG